MALRTNVDDEAADSSFFFWSVRCVFCCFEFFIFIFFLSSPAIEELCRSSRCEIRKALSSSGIFDIKAEECAMSKSSCQKVFIIVRSQKVLVKKLLSLNNNITVSLHAFSFCFSASTLLQNSILII